MSLPFDPHPNTCHKGYFTLVLQQQVIHPIRQNDRADELQARLKDIKSWTTSDFLPNSDETEVIVFGPKLLRGRLDRVILLDGVDLTP